LNLPEPENQPPKTRSFDSYDPTAMLSSDLRDLAGQHGLKISVRVLDGQPPPWLEPPTDAKIARIVAAVFFMPEETST